MDLNLELMKRRFTGRRIATWGHIKAYVKDGNPLDMAIERWQMRSSDHVFAYTRMGADFAIAAGSDPAKVTAVINSTDVSATLAESESMNEAFLAEFSEANGLTAGRTFGFIGGIDSAKRVDFLASALDILWERDSRIKLVVGGRGDQEELLTRAVGRGQVVLVGYAGPAEKALINHLSEAVLNPGRIGLLAVECLAMGLPIITTDWRHHGPEYEYLQEGRDVFRSGGHPGQFAELVQSFTKEAEGRRRPRPHPYPTVGDMVRNYAQGVVAMMS